MRLDPRTWPWWVQTLGVYAVARGFSAVVLMVVASQQAANGWTGAGPGYLDYTGLMWDASWYKTIAEGGYPATLPVGTDGLVEQNAWAFFPLFPFLVRALMTVTGGSWATVAPLTALVLGAAAMVVVYRLVVRGAPRAVAAVPALPLITVTLVSVFPTSVVLQVGYTESLALLLVAASLLLIVTRRYGWAALAVVALGFTRAVALPMAAVVLVHAWVRWRQWRAAGERPVVRDLVGIGGLGVAAVVSGVAWPAICGWVTGVSDGYLQTQGAWRGSRDIVPFGSWGYISRFWFGSAAPLVLAGAAVVVLIALLAPATWRLGRELHAWCAAYLLYLAAAIEPGSSLARFLLLAFPLGAATAGVVLRPAWARRAWWTLVVVAMLVLQVVWVWRIWRLVPPSGWPP
ncbi:MAG TPA: hypothetical protein VGC67_03455 [Cellulomonas sp.]